jgi:hypothetical protein
MPSPASDLLGLGLDSHLFPFCGVSTCFAFQLELANAMLRQQPLIEWHCRELIVVHA